MAGLISTGIWGFICSATMKAGKITATFISGATGWIIRNNGDAEFKSIYARDKIVTNEYVYNRIRVSEDEEVITSSIKILSAVDNEDGTWTIYPDLREGDVNPLANDDLLQGYYHSPGDSGVIYSVQRFTAIDDPSKIDQSIIITCDEGSIPYKHMIIVRVGNERDADRQSFIRISSRTNCQYFYDEISSFIDLDNPDKVKCALGKVDVGLIPAWAASAVGSIKKLFGLIADGVILRGIFILKSSGKTIEKELEGVGETITAVETRFEIKEGQISSKVTEAKKYAENAESSASSASGSASAAAGSAVASEAAKVISVEKASEVKQTAEGFTQTVTEKTEIVVSAANAAAESAKASEEAKKISVEKASEAKQTAEGFQSTVTETTKKAVTDAVAGADETIETKVSTSVTQSAKKWKVEVMGADEQGNPNTILAAINADESGIQIKGDKVEIDGTLLAKIIMATGLNINDKFVVTIDKGEAKVAVNGEINATSGIFSGSIATPFFVYEGWEDVKLDPTGKLGHNFTYITKVDDINMNVITVSNISDAKFNGHVINFFVFGNNGLTLTLDTGIKLPSFFIRPGSRLEGGEYKEGDCLRVKEGAYVSMQGIQRFKDDDRTWWIITNFDSNCMELLNYT